MPPLSLVRIGLVPDPFHALWLVLAQVGFDLECHTIGEEH